LWSVGLGSRQQDDNLPHLRSDSAVAATATCYGPGALVSHCSTLFTATVRVDQYAASSATTTRAPRKKPPTGISRCCSCYALLFASLQWRNILSFEALMSSFGLTLSFRAAHELFRCFMACLHDPANVRQTSSKCI